MYIDYSACPIFTPGSGLFAGSLQDRCRHMEGDSRAEAKQDFYSGFFSSAGITHHGRGSSEKEKGSFGLRVAEG